jgi:hypothetical protein
MSILACPDPVAAGATDGIRHTNPGPRKDHRVVRDRLHPRNNRDGEDYSFLNAVGAVWSADIPMSAVGYSASTGFLIDPCHVLTNMHVVYSDEIVVDPSIGRPVSFAVGQTDGPANRGAVAGLRFLIGGVVAAHGDVVILDHVVHHPENDWALIRLAANADDSVVPLTIGSVDAAQLSSNPRLYIAGFPADLRERRGYRLDLKDLWGSDGRVVDVVWASTAGAVIESTIQATRGSSGSPLYGDFGGRRHIVIGMHQGIRGNGIDVSEDEPNTQVFFTPDTLAGIRAAQAQTPCR